MESGNDVYENRRILVIDDMAALHGDFRRILSPSKEVPPELAALPASALGSTTATPSSLGFEVECAFGGEAGLEQLRRGLAMERPFAMAFVDMRMPSGWDGLQTIEALWRYDADLEVVICSAYSDFSQDDVLARLGVTDRVLILEKPFEAIEVCQLARALTVKWALRQQARIQLAELERRIATRTRELASANALLISEIQRNQAATLQLRHEEGLVSIGRLAAAVAHELGGALATVATSLESARHDLASAPPDPALHAATERIDAATAAMRHMSTQITRMEKLASRDGAPGQTLDVNAALASFARVFVEGLHGTAEVATDYGELPLVECAPSEVSLVLLGLIDNAVGAVEECKRTTGRIGKVSITTRRDAEDVVISIADTGAAIPTAKQATMFEPYAGKEGLGLAHAIIVDRHHGALTVDSGPDRGSTFVVRLPRRQTVVPAAIEAK